VADVAHHARAVDQDVQRCHRDLEALGERAVRVDRERHGQRLLRPERAHGLDRIVDPEVDRIHRDAIAVLPVGGFEVRHLLAARLAPRRPELEVDRLAPGQLGERDAAAVEQRQRRRRCAVPDQRGAGRHGALLTLADLRGLDRRAGRLGGHGRGRVLCLGSRARLARQQHHARRDDRVTHGYLPPFAVTGGTLTGTS
jgi:hypothetical protein